MAQTGTQQAKYSCSQCGKTFESAQALSEHKKNCQGGDAAAAKPHAKPDEQEIKTDMLIEDRFEATDN